MIRSTGFFAIILSFSLLISCSSEGDEGGGENIDSQGLTPSVEAVEARYGSLPLVQRLSGTVRAENQVELYPEISGRVEEVYVQDGDEVRRGDPLVKIRDLEYREQMQQAEAGYRIEQARLRQAQARLSELEAEYRRTSTLAERELISALELETIQAQMESAEADVQLAEAQVEQAKSTLDERQDLLERTTIRSPIDGVVGQRNAEVGMQATSSSRLFTVGNLDRLKIRVNLTDNMLRFMQVGQTAQIGVVNGDGEQELLTATLTRISPFLNDVTRSTEAEIEVNNENRVLRPGSFVPVDILYGESEQATLVPTSALFTDPETGDEGIFVATSLGSEVEPPSVEEGEEMAPLTEPIDVEFRQVDVIARGRMEVAVGNIDRNEWVVTVGQDLLSTGRNQARVRPITWDRVLALQGLQSEDLLRSILERQDSTES
jgi:HlyD family secretion protein